MVQTRSHQIGENSNVVHIVDPNPNPNMNLNTNRHVVTVPRQPNLNHSHTHSSNNLYDPNYPERDAPILNESAAIAKLRRENEILSQLLNKQMLRKVVHEPFKLAELREAETIVSSSKDEYDEVNSKRKFNEGVVDEKERQASPNRSGHHSVFEHLGTKGVCKPNRVTKSVQVVEGKENPLNNWAEKNLQKLIHSAIADKIEDEKSAAELARRVLGEDHGFSFTERIQNAPPSKKFRQSKFSIYDGQSDLVDHVRHYKKVMAYWRGEEALMCRMFPASLGDTALRWFDKLPPAKIDSFRELVDQFTARFITNSIMIKGPKALTQLKKKQGETLREYSQRYFELYQEAEDCDPRFSFSTFKFGLPYDSNGIYNDLTRRPPKTFNDLLARVDEFSRVEDDDKAMNKQ